MRAGSSNKLRGRNTFRTKGDLLPSVRLVVEKYRVKCLCIPSERRCFTPNLHEAFRWNADQDQCCFLPMNAATGQRRNSIFIRLECKQMSTGISLSKQQKGIHEACNPFSCFREISVVQEGSCYAIAIDLYCFYIIHSGRQMICGYH